MTNEISITAGSKVKHSPTGHTGEVVKINDGHGKSYVKWDNAQGVYIKSFMTHTWVRLSDLIQIKTTA